MGVGLHQEEDMSHFSANILWVAAADWMSDIHPSHMSTASRHPQLMTSFCSERNCYTGALTLIFWC